MREKTRKPFNREKSRLWAGDEESGRPMPRLPVDFDLCLRLGVSTDWAISSVLVVRENGLHGWTCARVVAEDA